MLKKRTLLFFVILLFVAVQFGVQSAMAFSDYEEEPAASLTISGWTVNLLPLEKSGDNWRWKYEITNLKGDATGLNFAAMLIPDCNEELGKITVTDLDGFTTFFEVGEGEPTDSFGKYNVQAFVAKGTPVNQNLWSFVANTNKTTTSTILLDTRGKTGELTFEMAVPACDPGPEAPITQSAQEFTYVNNAGETYKVNVYKDQDGNITKVMRFNPGDEDGIDITDDGISVTQIKAKFLDANGELMEEFFNFIPDDTVTKSGENSNCGYWYNGVFWNFCN